MTYIFDIDGTICSNTNGKYGEAQPYTDRIKKINELYAAGNTIIFFTARGMGRSGNSEAMAYNLFYEFTKQQLQEWSVKYHSLFLGKPSGDVYIDDKAIRDDHFFEIQSFE